jgi:CBS domain containing-hemolysin-like protein
MSSTADKDSTEGAERLLTVLPPAPATNWLTRLRERLGFEDADKRAIREVLDKALRAEGEGGQVLAPQQRDMLLRIVRFGELRVADVMVPRADINAVDEQAPLSELLQVFQQAGHSRIPLYRETLDDLRGMVHIKDLMGWMVEQASTGPVVATTAAHAETPMHFSAIDLTKANLNQPISATKIRRQVLFVPPSMPALNLLLRMQSTRVHLAMVVDEYGGTDGLVSIEDLVEQIVGEIEDEHDDEDDLIQGDAAAGYVALARTPVSELEQKLGLKLVTDPKDAEDFDTIGGLVVALIGRVPVRGELIHHPSGLEFEILDADPRRIKKLRVHMTAGGAAASANPPDLA